MRSFIKLSAVLACLALPGQGAAQQLFAGVNITSLHMGAARKFNSDNRGFYAGLRWGQRVQYGIEGGFFQNSYDVQSTYALGFMDFPIAQFGAVQLRAGAWAGMFEYPEFAQKAYGKGLPIWGSYIGIPGLSFTARMGRTDLRLKVTRGLTNASAIITLQAGVTF